MEEIDQAQVRSYITAHTLHLFKLCVGLRTFILAFVVLYLRMKANDRQEIHVGSMCMQRRPAISSYKLKVKIVRLIKLIAHLKSLHILTSENVKLEA